MSDNPPEPTPPAEDGTPNTVTNISGGVNLDAQHDVNVGSDVVGGDKVMTNIATGGVTISGLPGMGGAQARPCSCWSRSTFH